MLYHSCLCIFCSCTGSGPCSWSGLCLNVIWLLHWLLLSLRLHIRYFALPLVLDLAPAYTLSCSCTFIILLLHWPLILLFHSHYLALANMLFCSCFCYSCIRSYSCIGFWCCSCIYISLLAICALALPLDPAYSVYFILLLLSPLLLSLLRLLALDLAIAYTVSCFFALAFTTLVYTSSCSCSCSRLYIILLLLLFLTLAFTTLVYTYILLLHWLLILLFLLLLSLIC